MSAIGGAIAIGTEIAPGRLMIGVTTGVGASGFKGNAARVELGPGAAAATSTATRPTIRTAPTPAAYTVRQCVTEPRSMLLRADGSMVEIAMSRTS